MEKLAFFSFHFKCFPLLFSLDKVICPIYSNKHCVHLGRETINHDNARRILTHAVRKFIKNRSGETKNVDELPQLRSNCTNTRNIPGFGFHRLDIVLLFRKTYTGSDLASSLNKWYIAGSSAQRKGKERKRAVDRDLVANYTSERHVKAGKQDFRLVQASSLSLRNVRNGYFPTPRDRFSRPISPRLLWTVKLIKGREKGVLLEELVPRTRSKTVIKFERCGNPAPETTNSSMLQLFS